MFGSEFASIPIHSMCCHCPCFVWVRLPVAAPPVPCWPEPGLRPLLLLLSCQPLPATAQHSRWVIRCTFRLRPTKKVGSGSGAALTLAAPSGSGSATLSWLGISMVFYCFRWMLIRININGSGSWNTILSPFIKWRYLLEKIRFFWLDENAW